MVLLLFIWATGYIAAKYAQMTFQTGSLIFLKYIVGLVVVFIIKHFVDPNGRFKKKDLPVLIACVIFGEIIYFYSEYEAMNYMPVALITIVLALVPAVSILIERILFKKRATWKMGLGVIVGVVGISLVIGADFSILFQGRFLGYMFSFIAVLTWNIYNFVTHRISEHYSGITLAFNQIICTLLIMLPLGIVQITRIEEVKAVSVFGLIYIGAFTAGLGSFLYIWCLRRLGPTVTAVYSNFLPIATALFGFLVLGEQIGVIQIAGGVVVIASGYLIITERGKTGDSLQS